jgi:hypothetical protein
MINKIILTILLLVTILYSRENIAKEFPYLTKKEIAYYKKQINSLEEIDAQYKNFDTLTEKQKILLKNKVKNLIPYYMMLKSLKNDDIHAKEFVTLYAILMNYKAYILIDKYADDSTELFMASMLARLVHEIFPKELAYLDTFLWSEVKNGRYDKALEQYPMLLEATSHDKDIQAHYDYVLLNAKFNPKELIRKIKKVINKSYYTTSNYDKELLFKELDSIPREEKDEFIKSVNSIMKKYINNEISIFTQKRQNRTKESKKIVTKSLKYYIKDESLYLKPDSLYTTLYDDIKKVLQKSHLQIPTKATNLIL